MMKTIAVTGSSGFIGKHLVKALNQNHYNTIELDLDKGINLLSKKDIHSIAKFDVIIHLAAKTYVPLSLKHPWDFFYHNYNLTLNVLELSRKFGARVIFFSSYLYGNPDYTPVDEKHQLKPHNPYSQSKIICEKLCEGYSRDFGIPIVVFRPFNVYGRGQNNEFIIPSIINQLRRGVINLKDPRPKRDFIYIDDVIRAVLLAINFDSANYEVFNLGTGISYSIAEVVKIICKISGDDPKINFTDEIRQGEVLDTIADSSKIKIMLKWSAKTSLQAGIKNILET